MNCASLSPISTACYPGILKHRCSSLDAHPGYVGMYIDGEKVWEHYDDRVGSLPSYIILSLQVGGWDGNEKNISDDFEANMLVDFVRVWSNSEFN